jgi:hypothetical protein
MLHQYVDPKATETEMHHKAEFLSLAEELQSHILSFLPWRDILRCASVSYDLLIDVDVTVLDHFIY